MAKKREFQADKPHASLLDKLYITPKQRLSLLKWLLIGVILLILSVLQDVVLCRFRILGATTDLVPCAIILICIMEGVEKGCLFALWSSLIYQFSGSAPGMYAMVFLTVLAILAAIFRQSYLQKGFGVAMLCTGVAMLVYEMLIFGTGLFLEQTYLSRIGVFALTAIFSLLTVPALYPVCKAIGKIGGEIWKE